MKFSRFTFLVLLVLLVFLAAVGAEAQFAVYGEFTASKFNLDGSASKNWLYGGAAGAYYDTRHFAVLEPGVDARAIFQKQTSSGSSLQARQSGDSLNARLAGGFLGPRLAVHVPALPLRPYGEALLGFSKTRASQSFDPSFTAFDHAAFAYQLIAGADFTVLPHVDWRVAEFTFTGVPSINSGSVSHTAHTNAVGTGVVIRF